MAYQRDIELLCDRIYDGAVNAETWPSTLDEIADSAGCAWAALLVMRNDAWAGWSISPSVAPQLQPYLRSDCARQSITTERLFGFDRPGFVSDQDLFTEDEYRTDVFVEWANSCGFHHGAATGIRLNNGDLAVVQVMRRTGEQRFSASDIQVLDGLRPHLARAALLAARWKMERLRAATQALELVGIPAMVLTGNCRVMAANTLVDTMTGHVRWLAGDGVALIDPAASTKLAQQVSSCIHCGSADSASSFPAWDEARLRAMVVHVIPLKGDRRELFDGGLALVVFTSAGSPSVPDCDLIRELFDLTPAEARVATELAAGQSIDEIAGAHQVGLSTIRSQAKSILNKVGAHRQAELAARLGATGTVRPFSAIRRRG